MRSTRWFCTGARDRGCSVDGVAVADELMILTRARGDAVVASLPTLAYAAAAFTACEPERLPVSPVRWWCVPSRLVAVRWLLSVA